jgi:hypothetical protein
MEQTSLLISFEAGGMVWGVLQFIAIRYVRAFLSPSFHPSTFVYFSLGIYHNRLKGTPALQPPLLLRDDGCKLHLSPFIRFGLSPPPPHLSAPYSLAISISSS